MGLHKHNWSRIVAVSHLAVFRHILCIYPYHVIMTATSFPNYTSSASSSQASNITNYSLQRRTQAQIICWANHQGVDIICELIWEAIHVTCFIFIYVKFIPGSANQSSNCMHFPQNEVVASMPIYMFSYSLRLQLHTISATSCQWKYLLN